VAHCEEPLHVYKDDYTEPRAGYVSMRVPFSRWGMISFWAPEDVVAKAVAARTAAEKRAPRVKIGTTRVSAGVKPPPYEGNQFPIAACVAEAEADSGVIVTGHIDVSITIGPTGKPAKVVVKPVTAIDPRLATCLQGAFDVELRADDGTRAKGGSVEVAVDIAAR
jgi:hypothetical protein